MIHTHPSGVTSSSAKGRKERDRDDELPKGRMSLADYAAWKHRQQREGA